MQILRKSSEAQMILEFLKMEYQSERFHQKLAGVLAALGQTEALLFDACLDNEMENKRRRTVMGVYRGYGQNQGLFENFPKDITWSQACFTQGDLARLRYIRYDYWDKLSGETSRPADAARNIRRGLTVFDVPNDGFHAAAQVLARGVRFPPLIFLYTGQSSSLFYLVEGHKRATAYAMYPQAFPGTLCYAGLCGETALKRWRSGEENHSF